MTTNNEHPPGFEPSSSSGASHGGSLALVGGAILALLGGLAKHADDIFRPLARSGDDIARAVGRHGDDTVGPLFHHADDFGRVGANHTDEVVDAGESTSAQTLMRAAEHGARHLARQQDHEQANPAIPAPDLQSNNAIELQATVRDMKETYRKRDDGFFYVTETYSVSRMEPAGDEAIESAEEVDTELPDEMRGEFERLSLKREGDSVLLLEESHFDVAGSSLDFSVEAEVEFVEGTWNDYEAGKQVSVRYSAKGLELMKREYQKQMTPQWQQIAVGQFGSDAGATISLLEMPNTTLVINSTEIRTTTDGPMKIHCRIVP